MKPPRTVTQFDHTAQKFNAVVAIGLALFCLASVATAAKVMGTPTIVVGISIAAVMLVYGIRVARLTKQGRILPGLRYPGTFLPLFFLSLLKLSMLFGRLGYGGVLKDTISFDAFFLIVILSAFYGERRLTMLAGLTAAGLNLALIVVGIAFFGIRPTSAVEAAVSVDQVRPVIEVLRCSLFVAVALAMNVISGHLQTLMAGLQRSEADARALVGAVARVQPQIRSVLDPIHETADSIAARAQEQAGAFRQIGCATGDLADSVKETAANADESRTLTAQTRADAESGNQKLAAVRGEFQQVLGRIEAVDQRLASVAESLERTEAINQAIRDLSDRLRYLAINASLEAAKAGEHGSGFSVVAHEVQKLVRATSEDLQSSRSVLGDIRGQIAALSLEAGQATACLRDSVAGLDAAGALIDRVVASFARTAEQVESFASTASGQAQRISEVSAALNELDRGASDLNTASATLQQGVDAIAGAHQELEALLAGKAGALTPDGSGEAA